jgi:transcription elongation factor GreA
MRKIYRPKPQAVEFTRAGFEKIQQELSEWEAKREAAVKDLATARTMGDLSENAAYTAARRRLSAVDYQIRRLKMLVRTGVIVEPPKGEVGIGSIVTVQTDSGEQTYTIVGGQESDILNGKLSQFSPIGKALMGKKEGQITIARTPIGEKQLTVLRIE